MNADFWNLRYDVKDFVFGTEPNAYVKETAPLLPPGPVLCLAEGEGRNAVHLAELGHVVTAMDQSATGLNKARSLAASRGVTIATIMADLADYTIAPGSWSGVVSIFVHLPRDLRRFVHRQIVAGLRPGGLYIMEAYTPAQLAFGTGGPKDVDLLITLAAVRDELDGLDLLIGREIERDVIEGTGHTGRAAVVQILARRPNP